MSDYINTWVQSLHWEDLLEEGMATHSSTLALMDRGAWQATVHGVPKSQATELLSAHTHINIHRKGQEFKRECLWELSIL